MPLMVEGAGAASARGGFTERSPRGGTRPLAIGLVNNMPDGALKATERQFARALAAGAGAREVRLHLFALPGVPRGGPARSYMAGRYGDLSALRRAKLDGLIVTGAEPRAARLADEPYWDALARVIDWAEHNTASAIWSCLAAHAAVFHLDGIARRRMPTKRSGLFACTSASPKGLLDGAAPDLMVPHSRWNDLAESDLLSHGYRIASRSAEAGVDAFTKQWASLFVFLQGHPEYDPDTLFREYRRDAQRYLRGETVALPEAPTGYFDARTGRAVEAFAERVRSGDPGAWDAFPRDWSCDRSRLDLWQSSSSAFYQGWLARVAAVVR